MTRDHYLKSTQHLIVLYVAPLRHEQITQRQGSKRSYSNSTDFYITGLRIPYDQQSKFCSHQRPSWYSRSIWRITRFLPPRGKIWFHSRLCMFILRQPSIYFSSMVSMYNFYNRKSCGGHLGTQIRDQWQLHFCRRMRYPVI